jgi:glycosyltransferase involved in cell wall biosynthesis
MTRSQAGGFQDAAAPALTWKVPAALQPPSAGGFSAATKEGADREPVATLWFDVEDLLLHFQHAARPTGIQRLTFELYREVWKQAGVSGRVRFCRHGSTPDEYLALDWPELEAGIVAASAAPPPKMAAPVRRRGIGRLRRFLSPRITPSIRMPLGVIYVSCRAILRACGALMKASLLALIRPMAPTELGAITIQLATRPASFKPGDVFVALGASWGPLNAAAGRQARQRFGMRFAVMVHDLVPELYPEWTSSESLSPYRGWLREVVPCADQIFVYSRNSAKDLLGCMARWGKQVPEPVVLPVGHAPLALAERTRPKRFDRPFVLFVSTIEVRKNHALLLRVWRRLLQTMPEAKVPYLVFAGKRGWLTRDLMVQFANTAWLDGHIRLVESPSEAELAALYADCAFTVFPSLYEGWGLPVTEALSFGKTVAASNRAAIPEAGGPFCVYFDPENLTQAYEVIRDLIENPAKVKALEARIRAEFRQPSWAESAAILLDHLFAPAATERALGQAD